MNRQICYIVVLFLFLFGCSGGGGGSSSSDNDTVTYYTLGTLPNGSTAWSSQSTFAVSSEDLTSGSIGLSGGTAGVTYGLSLSVDQAGPSITTIPKNCVLVSGSTTSCQFVFDAESALNGTYTVSVLYSQLNQSLASGSSALPNKLTFIISGGSLVRSGNLVISPIVSPSIIESSSTSATVTLSDSQGITTPVSVELVSNAPQIISLDPTNCLLTTTNNSCTVNILGESYGVANFTASATGYTSVTSNYVTVNQAPIIIVPGSLSISAFAESVIEFSESTIATVSLVGSTGITTPLQVNFTSNNSSVISVLPSGCALTTANPSCVVSIIGNSGGIATFTASAYNYVNVQSESLTVNPQTSASLVTPSVAQVGVGVGTPIIVSFSAPIESTTVNSSSFSIVKNGGAAISPVAISVESNGSGARLLFTGTFGNGVYLEYNESYTVYLSNAILDKNNHPIESYSAVFRTQVESYLIFRTHVASGLTGDLRAEANTLYSVTAPTGIVAADAICQNDSSCSVGKVCRALISDGTLRQALPTPIDWVLESYTAYRNESGLMVSVTGVTGSVVSYPPYLFSFNLSSSVGTGAAMWTGMTTTWQNSPLNCINWGSALANENGTQGSLSAITALMLDSTSGNGVSCNTAFNGVLYSQLYCVAK